MADETTCPACGSAVVSTYPQVGGAVTVYRFSCGRRDRHWKDGGYSSLGTQLASCKEIAKLRKALHRCWAELATEHERNHPLPEPLRQACQEAHLALNMPGSFR